MADYRKHRLATLNYAFDFADQLATGAALTGTPTVVITQSGTDVTSQFGALAPAIDGTTVTWTLNAASGSDQDGGTYRLLIECDTDDSEHLVGELVDAKSGEVRVPTLLVHEDGDPDAP